MFNLKFSDTTFSTKAYGITLAIAIVLLSISSTEMLNGTALFELIAVAIVPLLVILFARYVYQLETISISALDEINELYGDAPMNDEDRVTKLFYLKRILYSSFLAFQHSYVFFAFVVIFLWYQSPNSGDHLEPLTLFFGALAGFMEWIRSLVKQWVFIK